MRPERLAEIRAHNCCCYCGKMKFEVLEALDVAEAERIRLELEVSNLRYRLNAVLWAENHP